MKFKVYIGGCMSTKSHIVKAEVEPFDTYFPHGDVSEKGEILINITHINYFSSFEKAATYFADLFDIIDKNAISAEIHLNLLSVKRILCGKEIVHFFDALQNMSEQKNDYTALRNFDFMENEK